jgi:hypothetical protein
LNGDVVFFALNEAAKARLVEFGAHPESVYTRDELGELVRAGVEPGQLLVVHEARGVFDARISPAEAA